MNTTYLDFQFYLNLEPIVYIIIMYGITGLDTELIWPLT